MEYLLYSNKVKAGKYSYGIQWIEHHHFDTGNEVIIGNFCSIAQKVQIFTGGYHRSDWITTYPFGGIYNQIFPNGGIPHVGFDNSIYTSKGNVTIGNDVWIGMGVVIMSGVTIGDGAIIAANSLISKDVEPYSVIGGNPGKLIRKRYSEEQIQKLLKIKWWDWSEDKINQALPLLQSSNINKFIESYENSLM